MITWDDWQESAYQKARSLGVLVHRYSFYRLYKVCIVLAPALDMTVQEYLDGVIDALSPSGIRLTDIGKGARW